MAPTAHPPAHPLPHVLAVDSGGSGLRIALAPARTPAPAPAQTSAYDPGRPVEEFPRRVLTSPEATRTGARGIDAHHLLERLLPAARALLAEVGQPPVAAVAVGAAGMATLGDDLRATLPTVLRAELGATRLALATDAVTAYAGALGHRRGVVVAAGTGVVALGVDAAGTGWRRADGWGHLLGDSGGGAWIGRAGLDAALRAHDGRAGGSPPLLARLRAVLGPPEELPARLYPRADRPAVLASFAPEVAACAADDPVAAGILRTAARHLAEAAEAVRPAPTGEDGGTGEGDERGDGGDGGGARADSWPIGLTGGLFRIGEPLLAPLREELARRLPGARSVTAPGQPLDGALRIAAALATDSLRLPVDGRLLWITDGT
ncbi:N-acetylglucosamine kinase [Streptomyces sp. URMC 123]|uniref:N-acetylglucosamine kinase n=1 Tax=Streptomyces sp. URMC 123 TaxID=3423403 RepID=UPI003F194804